MPCGFADCADRFLLGILIGLIIVGILAGVMAWKTDLFKPCPKCIACPLEKERRPEPAPPQNLPNDAPPPNRTNQSAQPERPNVPKEEKIPVSCPSFSRTAVGDVPVNEQIYEIRTAVLNNRGDVIALWRLHALSDGRVGLVSVPLSGREPAPLEDQWLVRSMPNGTFRLLSVGMMNRPFTFSNQFNQRLQSFGYLSTTPGNSNARLTEFVFEPKLGLLRSTASEDDNYLSVGSAPLSSGVMSLLPVGRLATQIVNTTATVNTSGTSLSPNPVVTPQTDTKRLITENHWLFYPGVDCK